MLFMKKKCMILFFLLISCIHYVYLQNYDVQPKCEENTIKYSIIADLKNYLISDNDNIDGRDLYGEVDDLKSKKVGILKDTYVIPGKLDNLILLEKLDDILRDLRNHKSDAIIVDNGVCNFTHSFSDDLSLLEGFLSMSNIDFAVQKDNITLINEINELLGSKSFGIGKRNDWYGFDEVQKYVNRELNGTKGYLNVMYRLDFPPYAYIENGEPVGS